MIKQNKRLSSHYRKVLLALFVLSSVDAVDLKATTSFIPLSYGEIVQQQKNMLKGAHLQFSVDSLKKII